MWGGLDNNGGDLGKEKGGSRQRKREVLDKERRGSGLR